MLDSTESSGLAIHEPERFEQLLAECRGRRNAVAGSGGAGGARGTGSSGEVAGRDATGGPGQALPGETDHQQLPTSPQPGFAGGAGGTQAGEPYVFKPFPVEAPRGYSVDPAVGIPRSQPQVPSHEGRNQGTLTCRSGGCAQR